MFDEMFGDLAMAAEMLMLNKFKLRQADIEAIRDGEVELEEGDPIVQRMSAYMLTAFEEEYSQPDRRVYRDSIKDLEDRWQPITEENTKWIEGIASVILKLMKEAGESGFKDAIREALEDSDADWAKEVLKSTPEEKVEILKKYNKYREP